MYAVIYTGQVRTIESVINDFKSNVLNDNTHVFAVLESDKPLYYEPIIKSKLQSHLKSLNWFDKHDSSWTTIKYQLAEKMDIPSDWKYYIRDNSGSMIEYYQMYLAYLEMETYEQEQNIKYDYIYRIRCDCVITRPISFNYNLDNMIKTLGKKFISKKDFISLMTSLIDSRRLLCDINRTCIINNDINTTNVQNIETYIKEGNFLIAYRENVFYFAPRKAFSKIYKLGIEYGLSKEYNDGYWFNAESQLKSRCINQGIDYYNSDSEIECKSLYDYRHENYYDNDKLVDRDDLLFFLKRS